MKYLRFLHKTFFCVILDWPEWYLDCDVAVYGDGEEAEDGVLCENQDEARDEQAAVEVGAEAGADDDGKGDGQHSHSDVSHRQGHHKEVGDALQVTVEEHRPADQHIPQNREHGDQQLQDDVQGWGDGVFWHGEMSREVTDEEGGNLSTSISAAFQLPRLLTSRPSTNIHQTPYKQSQHKSCFTGQNPSSRSFFPSTLLSHELLEKLRWCQQSTSGGHDSAGDKEEQK